MNKNIIIGKGCRDRTWVEALKDPLVGRMSGKEGSYAGLPSVEPTGWLPLRRTAVPAAEAPVVRVWSLTKCWPRCGIDWRPRDECIPRVCPIWFVANLLTFAFLWTLWRKRQLSTQCWGSHWPQTRRTLLPQRWPFASEPVWSPAMFVATLRRAATSSFLSLL